MVTQNFAEKLVSFVKISVYVFGEKFNILLLLKLDS